MTQGYRSWFQDLINVWTMPAAKCDEVAYISLGKNPTMMMRQEEVMTWFKGQAADFYDSGIQKLVPRLNLLKPNDIYICHTAALTSRRYILNIYSTNIHTEYFKHAA